MIYISCACGKRLRVKAQYAGKRGKCPACGASHLIPAQGRGETRKVFCCRNCKHEFMAAPLGPDVAYACPKCSEAVDLVTQGGIVLPISSRCKVLVLLKSAEELEERIYRCSSCSHEFTRPVLSSSATYSCPKCQEPVSDRTGGGIILPDVWKHVVSGEAPSIIKLSCGCGKELVATIEFAGRTGKCPYCGRETQLQVAAPAAEPSQSTVLATSMYLQRDETRARDVFGDVVRLARQSAPSAVRSIMFARHREVARGGHAVVLVHEYRNDESTLWFLREGEQSNWGGGIVDIKYDKLEFGSEWVILETFNLGEREGRSGPQVEGRCPSAVPAGAARPKALGLFPRRISPASRRVANLPRIADLDKLETFLRRSFETPKGSCQYFLTPEELCEIVEKYVRWLRAGWRQDSCGRSSDMVYVGLSAEEGRGFKFCGLFLFHSESDALRDCRELGIDPSTWGVQGRCATHFRGTRDWVGGSMRAEELWAKICQRRAELGLR